MKKLTRLLSSFCLILCVCIPYRSFSNCEAGGYSIHTKATYKSHDQQVYAILRGKSIEINSIDDFGADTPSFRKSLVGDYGVQYQGKDCGTAKIQVDGLDEYENPSLSIGALSCIDLEATRGSYILIDKEKKKLVIGTRLKVDGPFVEKELNPKVNDIIHNTKFSAIYPNGTIDKADILNLESFPVYSIKLGNDFSVLIATLYIKNVAKYFKSKGYAYYGEQYMKFENTKVGYPVLMFSSKGNIEYIGDGSECAEVPVMYRNMELVNREEKLRDPTYKAARGGTARPDDFPKDKDGLFDLGVLDRFQITNAFDMNGDGEVDIIEINDRFAYRILEKFKFEVINMGTGC